jgi:hypothetical protein
MFGFLLSSFGGIIRNGLKLFYPFKRETISHASAGSTSFDGTDDYVDLGTPLSYTNHTVCGWFKANDTASTKIILDARDSGTDGIFIAVESGENITYRVGDGGTSNDLDSSTGYSNEWYHVSATYDGTTQKLYIDGILVASGSISISINTTNNAKIGTRSFTSNHLFFDGSLANVGIWSRALSASEVQGIMYKKYADLGSVDKANLVSWWGLDEESLGDEMVTGTDSDFTGAGNWSTVNAVATPNYDSGDEGHSSTMRIEANDGTNDRAELAVAQWDDSPVIGGQYQVSVEYKYINNDGSPTTKLSMLGVNKSLDSSNTEWTSYTDTIVAVDDSTQFRFYVSQTGGTADNEVLIDNLSIRPYVVEDLEGSNDGTTVGSTTNSTIYGDNAPQIPRILDVAPDSVKNYGTLKSGTALSFDGTNDYCLVPDSSELIFSTNDFTISCWAKWDADSSFEALITKGSGSGANSYAFGTRATSGQVSMTQNNTNYLTTTGIVSTNWNHFVLTRSGDVGTIYVNGSSNVTDATYFNGVDLSDTSDISIGARTEGASHFFGGGLSSAKIFNSALTESEIQEMYLNPEQILPTGVSSSNLKLWLPFQERTGTQSFDGSGNQNHGTIAGATWDTANTDIAQVGLVRQNKPMVFDGVDDEVPLTLAATGLSAFTIGMHLSIPQLQDTALMTQYQDTNNYFRIAVNASGDLRSYWKVGGTFVDASYYRLTENQLYSTYYVYDGANYIHYIDGASVSSVSASALNAFTTSAIQIGAYKTTAFGEGLINEVAIWDEALTATEITALYNSGTPLDASADSGNYASSDGLQGYWRNDGDTTWTDRSTNSNHGTVAGSPTSIVLTEGITSGRDSQGFYLTDTTENCLTLNGAEYVEIPDSEALDFGTGDFSIECWIKTTDATGASIEFISKRAGLSNSVGVMCRISTSGYLATEIDDGAGNEIYITDSSALNDNTWYHAVFTYDRSGDCNIYKDGVSVANTSISAVGSIDNSSVLYIGRLTSHFTGKIDDVRIYSDALSSDEVTKNYNAGKSKHS